MTHDSEPLTAEYASVRKHRPDVPKSGDFAGNAGPSGTPGRLAWLNGWLGLFLATVIGLGKSKSVHACSTCYGDPDSTLTQGAQLGVLTMLIITYAALVGLGVMFAVVVIQARKRTLQDARSV